MNLIDLSRHKAQTSFQNKKIIDFEHDIKDFPGIINIKTGQISLKIFENNTIKKIPCIAIAEDNAGIFFCVTQSGERVCFEKRYVIDLS